MGWRLVGPKPAKPNPSCPCRVPLSRKPCRSCAPWSPTWCCSNWKQESVRRFNEGKPEAERIPHWHPHQLRHTRALELKREAGLDVARAVLGHKCPAITEHYATLDIAKAAEVMGKIG